MVSFEKIVSYFVFLCSGLFFIAGLYIQLSGFIEESDVSRSYTAYTGSFFVLLLGVKLFYDGVVHRAKIRSETSKSKILLSIGVQVEIDDGDRFVARPFKYKRTMPIKTIFLPTNIGLILITLIFIMTISSTYTSYVLILMFIFLFFVNIIFVLLNFVQKKDKTTAVRTKSNEEIENMQLLLEKEGDHLLLQSQSMIPGEQDLQLLSIDVKKELFDETLILSMKEFLELNRHDVGAFQYYLYKTIYSIFTRYGMFIKLRKDYFEYRDDNQVTFDFEQHPYLNLLMSNERAELLKVRDLLTEWLLAENPELQQ